MYTHLARISPYFSSWNISDSVPVCVCEHHRLLCDDAGPKQQKKCPLGQKSENWDVCAASETRGGGILDPLRIFDFFDIRHE